ncbi:hypothetical protein ABFX02_14G291000 [Erythranthe guttata]
MAAATTILEECEINPPAGSSPPEFVVPIVFFDMVWYDFAANQSVLFFDLTAACSTKPYFLETLVPDLKSSLSLTLGEFLPLAGKIVHPLTPGGDKPILRYQSGDSVSFNVCESGADFSELAGNHPRNCDDFYAFVPNLPPAKRSEKSICCAVLALQVTLFPGHGFCIGFVTHHAAADASTVVSFIQTWALINKTKCPNNNNNNNNNINNSDLRDLLTRSNCLPCFDRNGLVVLGPHSEAILFGGAAAGEIPDRQAPVNIRSQERADRKAQGFARGSQLSQGVDFHSRMRPRVGLLGQIGW